jgi:hypothetical protein
MSELIGYGEDGLTLRVMTRHLPELLMKLGDDSKPEECLRFYRPSFGRRGGQDRAEFGEFDAILATCRAVYPFESKWIRSAVPAGLMEIEPQQVLRHRIFQWLRERWQAEMKWQDFVAAQQAAFQVAFHKPLAPAGSSLADNIEYILNRLTAYPASTQHVVMAFYRDDCDKPEGVARCDAAFRLVAFPFTSINRGGLFLL